MKKNSQGNFSFDFRNLQHSEEFSFEAAGYNSKAYMIEVLSRPDLKFFETSLHFPSYLNKKDELLKNAGNLTIPEGTDITWAFEAINTEKLIFRTIRNNIKNDTSLLTDNQIFKFSKKTVSSFNYELELQNKYSENKEKISYFINVIPDE